MGVTNPALPMYVKNGKAVEREHQAVPADMYDIVAQVRAEKFYPYVLPKMRVLSYGIGLGYDLAGLECQRRVGYDVDTSVRTRLVRQKIEYRWETARIRSGTFDAVICHHVLEHVTDPWATLREIKRLLRDEGVLLLFVPYENERKYRRYIPDGEYQHLFSWNAQTLGNLVHNAGFVAEHIRTQPWGYDRFAADVVSRLGIRGMYKHLRDLLVFIRPHWEIAAVLRK